jgi:hypothetical protein
MNTGAMLFGLLDWTVRKRGSALVRFASKLFKPTTGALPILPDMSGLEYAFLHSLMRQHRDATYIEYGCGGSTLLADRFFREIIAFDTDTRWCDRMNAQLRHGRVHYIDVGETGDWGTPKEMTEENAQKIAACFRGPGLQARASNKLFVLIDGRCRVLTACHVFQYVKKGDIVLVHDFVDRREYYDILQMYDLRHVCGRLALLQRNNSDACKLAAKSLAAAFRCDFR